MADKSSNFSAIGYSRCFRVQLVIIFQQNIPRSKLSQDGLIRKVYNLPMPDYYSTLQVDRRAEPEVIAAASRSLARKYHPDKNDSAASTKRMQELNAAS